MSGSTLADSSLNTSVEWLHYIKQTEAVTQGHSLTVTLRLSESESGLSDSTTRSVSLCLQAFGSQTESLHCSG